MDFWLITLLTIVLFVVVRKTLWKPVEKDVRGKTVLITGGGSGIGKLMAIEFCKLSCKVIIWDINDKLLNETTEEIKSKLRDAAIFPFKIDITDHVKVRELAETIKRDIGEVHIVINNAGVVAGDFLWNVREDQMQRVMNVNSLAPMYVTKAFINPMLEKNSGHVVFIVSAAATAAAAKLADYAASKWAAFGFAEGFRMDLRKAKKTGVKTTIVCPFYINTGMFLGVKSNNPLLPILEPEDVVNQIMRAIKTDQEELFIPNIVTITYLARFILPVTVRDWMQDLMGVSKSMDEFHGLRKLT